MKRFSFYYEDLVEDENGQWIKYEDLAELEQQLQDEKARYGEMVRANADLKAENQQLRNLLDDSQVRFEELKAENQRLGAVLQELWAACMNADSEGELSDYVDGSLLDKARELIKVKTQLEGR